MGDELLPVPFEQAKGFTRRDFLKAGGATALIAGLTFERSGIARALLADAAQPFAATPSITFPIFRRLDMVDLTVRGYNLQLRTSPARLVRVTSGQDAFLVFEFGPQHLLEEAYHYPDQTPPGVPMRGRLAGPSRLAFKVPSSTTSVPYNIGTLLDWKGQGFVLQLPKNAVPTTPRTLPVAPAETETQIEAPWGLYLTPTPTGAWVHDQSPATSGQRTEIWHTRLGVTSGAKVLEPPEGTPQVRAVFSLPGVAFPPHSTPLTKGNRDALVLNMTKNKDAAATDVLFFSLSALGATMNLRGEWPKEDVVTGWKNRTAVGRDSFVRIIRPGFLYPFGFPASRIDDTQREFVVAPNGNVIAYLVKRSYLVVRGREAAYPSFGEADSTARQLPFTHVVINTLQSPFLDDGDPNRLMENRPTLSEDHAFWPRANDQDVIWSITGYDYDGRPVAFAMPLAFVYNQEEGGPLIAYNPAYTVPLASEYESGTGNSFSRRVRPVDGQRVTFTRTTTPGDTALPTNTLTFLGVALTGAADTQFKANVSPAFAPTIERAQVELSAAKALQGGGPLSDPSPAIGYHPSYLTNGFGGANAGEVFAELLGGTPAPDIPVDRAGGLAAPNFGISGLSRALGPLGGDLTNFAKSAPTFNPSDFFGGLKLPLFGAFDLVDLLATDVPVSTSGPSKLPKITNELVYPGGDKRKAPDGMVTRLDWHPTIQAHDPTTIFEALGPLDKSLDLDATFSTPLALPTFPNTYEVHGELRNFKLTLLRPGGTSPSDHSLDFIALTFSRARFQAKTGAKPDVEIGLDKVEFIGALTFVNQLKDFFGTSGKGPKIDVQPTGIEVSYTIGLPTIAVGVFSLANVAISAGLGLPFDGTPAHVDFALCSRERPFLLTMGLFGGGGFFGLSLAVDQPRMIEASIEFGAAVELNLGVASGGVHIMAGIYFRYANKPAEGTKPEHQEVELTGYLRAGGSLEVLGIITISVEFYLGFTYLGPDPGKAYGKASLSVSVSVAFFSVSVTLTVEKKIAGGGDPTFIDNVPTQAVWNTYCGAFA